MWGDPFLINLVKPPLKYLTSFSNLKKKSYFINAGVSAKILWHQIFFLTPLDHHTASWLTWHMTKSISYIDGRFFSRLITAKQTFLDDTADISDRFDMSILPVAILSNLVEYVESCTFIFPINASSSALDKDLFNFRTVFSSSSSETFFFFLRLASKV